MSKFKKTAKSAERLITSTLTSALELPKEVVMNLPLITIIGNEDLTIENFKGILEYSEERVRINTSTGIVRVEGKKLQLKQITSDNIVVVGAIDKLDFVV